MDTPSQDVPLEQRLRQALEPAPEAVRRVIDEALGARRPARSAGRLVPAGFAAAALLALAVLFVASPRPRRPPAIAIENVGDVIVVRPREGGRWLIHNGETGKGSAASGSVIFIHGGKR
jgi:hypothetical protein